MAMMEKVSISMDPSALEIGKQAAQRAGQPFSTWLGRAVIYCALVNNPGPQPTETQQLRDEEELAAEEAAHRAAG